MKTETDYNKKYIYVATNSDTDECSLCGRTGLSKVIWLREQETGDTLPYGTTCGRKMMGISTKAFKKWILEEKHRVTQKALNELINTEEYSIYCECRKNHGIYSDCFEKAKVEYDKKRLEIANKYQVDI